MIFTLCCVCSIIITDTAAQTNPTVVGFYNVENLFDTVDDLKIDDEEFLPNGANQWTEDKYQQKLNNISRVIAGFKPAILGVSEIENRKVLEDLVLHPNIKAGHYQIVHFDMQDARGIDVALLYQPSVFKPFKIVQVKITDPDEPNFKTRNILWVKGLFKGDTLHVAINHWPSRRGGGSETKRILAAKALRKTVDSVLQVNPKSNIVMMGDFNDDPNNRSIKKIVLAKDKSDQEPLINVAEPTFKKGRGTLLYDGIWNLFDQIFISSALHDQSECEYLDDSFRVVNFPWMLVPKGKYAGGPQRAFVDGVFNPDGFSDHLPVFILLNKQ